MSPVHVRDLAVRSGDGTPIFVRTTKRVPLAVLLIHGYLFSSEIFASQFAAELTRRYQVVAMDLRGHGRPGKPDHASAYLDAELWADDIACVVRALDLEQLAIVGWSMGARVALNYGHYHGLERVIGLNLVSAVVSGAQPGTQAPLPGHLVDLLAADVARRERCTEMFIRACAVNVPLARNHVNTFVAIGMDVPVVAREASRGWPVEFDGLLATLPVPLLVTYGAGDPLVPESTARELASSVPTGALSRIGGAHLPFLLDAHHFNQDLVAFLDHPASGSPAPGVRWHETDSASGSWHEIRRVRRRCTFGGRPR